MTVNGGDKMQIDRVKLIAEMARQRVSVKDLVKRSGISEATIVNVRAGKSCTMPTGILIAQALGMDLEDLEEVHNA